VDLTERADKQVPCYYREQLTQLLQMYYRFSRRHDALYLWEQSRAASRNLALFTF
jgi:hypothetical protein